MTRGQLTTTIDLEEGLNKLSERQSPSAAHFAVQLIRHALTFRPSEIEVSCSRDTFQLIQNGDFISAEEFRLLEDVSSSETMSRVRSLSILEKKYDITLLAALRRYAVCSIDSGGHRLSVGAAPPMNNYSSRRGHRIFIRDRLPSPRKIKDEVSFYCRHVPCRLIFNGHDLQTPIRLRDPVVEDKVAMPSGTVHIGVPRQGTLSRVRYFKQGVFFGVRDHLPTCGQVIDAAFDSNLTAPEDNFRDSIRAARAALQVATSAIYEHAFATFADLDPIGKTRLRDLFLATDLDNWSNEARRAPLFDSTTAPFSRSFESLLQECDTRGFLLFDDTHRMTCEGRLRLDPKQHRRLQTMLRTRLVPASAVSQLDAHGGRRLGTLTDNAPLRPRSAQPVVADTSMTHLHPHEFDELLQHLNVDPSVGFRWVQQEAAPEAKQAHTLVLPSDHPYLVKALRLLRRDPNHVAMVRRALALIAAK